MTAQLLDNLESYLQDNIDSGLTTDDMVRITLLFHNLPMAWLHLVNFRKCYRIEIFLDLESYDLGE